MDPKLSSWLASLAPTQAPTPPPPVGLATHTAAAAVAPVPATTAPAADTDAGDAEPALAQAGILELPGASGGPGSSVTSTPRTLDALSSCDSITEDELSEYVGKRASFHRFPPLLDGIDPRDTFCAKLHIGSPDGSFTPIVRSGAVLELQLELLPARDHVWLRGSAADASGGDVLFVTDVSAPVPADEATPPRDSSWLLFKAAPALGDAAQVAGGTGILAGPGPTVYGLEFESAIDATSSQTVLAEERAKLQKAAYFDDHECDDLIIDDAGAPRLASLDKLLDRLTFSRADRSALDDAEFSKFFLLTYRSFTSPVDLLAALFARFNLPLPAVLGGDSSALAEWQTTIRDNVRARVVKVLARWIGLGVRDFLDDPILECMLAYFLSVVSEAGFGDKVAEMQAQYQAGVADETLNMHLLDIVRLLETNVEQREAKWRMKSVGLCFQGQDAVDYLFHAGVCASRENAVAVGAQILSAGFITHVSGDANIPFDDNFQLFRFNLEVVESAARGMGSGSGNRPTPELPRDLNSFEVDDLPIVEFARQETLLEYALYSKIQPKELLGLAWSKKGKEELAPNVLGLIRRFNAMSLWVVTEITRRFQLKDRVKAVKYFVALAAKFRDMGNLNALQAVMSGFSNNSVKRLKFTWAKLDRKSNETLTELRELLDFKGSYRNLRNYLKHVVPPCIPFIGMYLTDLTFIHEGNPDVLDGLINFEKHSKVASIIHEMLTYQAIPFALETVPQIKLWLSHLDGADDDTTYDWSLDIEPREAHAAGSISKDDTTRFKSLGRRPRVFASTADSLARASKSVSAVHKASRARSAENLLELTADDPGLARLTARINHVRAGIDLSVATTAGRSGDADAPALSAPGSDVLDARSRTGSLSMDISGSSRSKRRRSRMPSQLLSASPTTPTTLTAASAPDSMLPSAASPIERLRSQSASARVRSNSLGVRLTDAGTGASPPGPPTAPPAAAAPTAPASAAAAPKSGKLPITQLIEAALDRDGRPGTPVRKVKDLLDAGVDIDDVNARGNSALHYVVIDSRLDVAKYLIARGASVDIPNLQGVTPLHIATLRNNLPMVKLLIMAGADPDETNAAGQNARDMTTNPEILELLDL
ncbi:Ras guanine nucleotide exchange factor A [Thecamonas trahens ATCC 50062]|uniref:Ras guanine nucleotide exchange factor A n=1 Tax=Thecamonas trahens ATCC 50062 TaxID=461836 RepID=A0A0L0DDH9_THETB|nr:Ras guanine nucleotide exchange factor A [Thecamonas trahens ATCC 50062]KNC50275.1 Ras guanine nucleotide exchange factor A [Thecamonas trahens ATCC 50062]|eukprot:XP_013757102.1 Ras guanine nucleotide exchange factor A [Thecamonas trahens ATCC 50062]